MCESLRKSRVLVVGTGTIGRQIVRSFTDTGANVVTWDLAVMPAPEPSVDATFTVNATDESAIDPVFSSTIETLGGLDVLVNGAGIVQARPFNDITREEWDAIISTNLTAAFLVAKRAIPVMKAGGGGSIINIGSISGLRGEPHLSHYSASKFGLIGLTQALAAECGPDNVRVNCVCPGAVDSPMNDLIIERDSRRWSRGKAEVRDSLISHTPLQRLCRPTDIANAVLFFASSASSFITGETLSVAGGLR